MIVAANKMDEDEAVKNLKKFKRRHKDLDIIPISCLSEEGIGKLKSEIYDICKKNSIKALKTLTIAPYRLTHLLHMDSHIFTPKHTAKRGGFT